MSGNIITHDTFKSMYTGQTRFQEAIDKRMDKEGKGAILPLDNPSMFQYHVTSLQEEIGEVLKADKRWKTHRNTAYDPEEKLDELADCFIILMNIGIWSGFTSAEVQEAIVIKMQENKRRLELREEDLDDNYHI